MAWGERHLYIAGDLRERSWVRFAKARRKVNGRQLASTEVHLRQLPRASDAPECTRMCHGEFVLRWEVYDGSSWHIWVHRVHAGLVPLPGGERVRVRGERVEWRRLVPRAEGSGTGG